MFFKENGMLVGICIIIVALLAGQHAILIYVLNSLRAITKDIDRLHDRVKDDNLDFLEAIQDLENNQAMLLRRLAETHPATDHPQPPAQPQSIQVFKGP